MARKSRKEYTQTFYEKSSDKKSCRVGFYLRLSEKDRSAWESESIENQRTLLMDFIKDKPELEWISTFTDDGKTGTNFRRNGFEQMMGEIKAGRINCVIVKDLSRFGRNYLETGHYLEYIFPFLNVRFISVTEGIDTWKLNPSQLSYRIPLKNIMNENYSGDISKKERSSKKILRGQGYFLGPYAMYGYEKTEGKHFLHIDSEAAPHVKKIFDLCEAGYSDSAIAKFLNRNQILSPSKYKYEKGILRNEKYRETSGWYPQTIATILTSRVYIGDMVQGKQGSREIRGKKERLPENEWDIVFGTHEAIISREQFERVQKIRKDRHENYMKMIPKERAKENILKGNLYAYPLEGALTPLSFMATPQRGMRVYCGDCKKAMVRKHVKSCHDEYRYLCGIYERNGQCMRKYLPEQELLETVNCIMKKQIQIFYGRKLQADKKNQKSPEGICKEERQRKEIEKSQKNLAERKAKLYRDWKEGVFNREEYLFRKKNCEKEMEGYQKEWAELSGRKEWILSDLTVRDDFYMTKELAGRLIEKIEVYGKDKIGVFLCPMSK